MNKKFSNFNIEEENNNSLNNSINNSKQKGIQKAESNSDNDNKSFNKFKKPQIKNNEESNNNNNNITTSNTKNERQKGRLKKVFKVDQGIILSNDYNNMNKMYEINEEDEVNYLETVSNIDRDINKNNSNIAIQSNNKTENEKKNIVFESTFGNSTKIENEFNPSKYYQEENIDNFPLHDDKFLFMTEENLPNTKQNNHVVRKKYSSEDDKKIISDEYIDEDDEDLDLELEGESKQITDFQRSMSSRYRLQVLSKKKLKELEKSTNITDYSSNKKDLKDVERIIGGKVANSDYISNIKEDKDENKNRTKNEKMKNDNKLEGIYNSKFDMENNYYLNRPGTSFQKNEKISKNKSIDSAKDRYKNNYDDNNVEIYEDLKGINTKGKKDNVYNSVNYNANKTDYKKKSENYNNKTENISKNNVINSIKVEEKNNNNNYVLLEEELSKIRKENIYLRQKLINLEEVNDFNETEKELQSIKEKLAKKIKELKESNHKLEVTEELNQEYESIIKDLKNKFSNLQTELSLKDEHIKMIKKEKNDDIVQSLKLEIYKLNKINEINREELFKKTEKINSLQERIIQLENEKNNDDFDENMTKIQKLKLENQELQNKYEIVNLKYGNLNEENSYLKKEIILIEKDLKKKNAIGGFVKMNDIAIEDDYNFSEYNKKGKKSEKNINAEDLSNEKIKEENTKLIGNNFKSMVNKNKREEKNNIDNYDHHHNSVKDYKNDNYESSTIHSSKVKELEIKKSDQISSETLEYKTTKINRKDPNIESISNSGMGNSSIIHFDNSIQNNKITDLENQISDLNTERLRLQCEFNKLPDNPKTRDKINKKSDLEERITELNKTINKLKVDLKRKKENINS